MDSTTTTYHVNPGGDETADGTEDAPLRTVDRALELVGAAEESAEIVLQPGLYPPLSLSNVQGTAGQPTVIRGQNPVPIDYSLPEGLDGNRMEYRPARRALDHGAWQLRDAGGLAVIAGGGGDGSELCECVDLRLEHLVFYNGRTGLTLRRCRGVTIADCVMTGEPARCIHGLAFRIGGPEDDPSREIRLERLLAYNLKECGFAVEPGALFDSCWECCIAHSMQSDGGDGFSFLHALKTDQPGGHPHRVFEDGVEYNITLRRCLALRNRLDGFDIGRGVGGVTLEMCLGDGNAWGEWHSKDLKIWSANNRLIQSRMTGRTMFIEGVTEMQSFKAGVFETRVGYGPVTGEAFADGARPGASGEDERSA